MKRSPLRVRYIRYARAIKPQITREAADKLVRMYKELRGEDAAPGTASAYRITVRQLEALVRLSEAMARVHCDPVIKVSHVDEAARLLRSSILKIEQSDIEFDERDAPLAAPAAQQQDGDVAMADAQEEGAPAAAVPAAAEAAAAPGKATTKITAQKFNFMRSMLAKKLTEVQQERMSEALEDGGAEQDESGMRQSELMSWYLDTQMKRCV